LYPSAILDEVQKIPSVVESIKAVYDRFDDSRYILTGSSQLLLMSKVRESLAGRCTIFELYPLTIPEILSQDWSDTVSSSFFQKYLESFELPPLSPSFMMDAAYAERNAAFRWYLEFGGYPALVDPALGNEERYEWLTGYVRTYLERDVRDLANFRYLEPFVKVQKMTSLLTGQLINYSDLAREAGVTAATAQRFVSYLDMSYQTIQLQPWTRNKVKRLTKSAKLHYLDPGIQRAIIGKRGGMSGNEFESAVVAEIFKQVGNINFPCSFYHLRTVDGREVDLLIETEKGYIAIEIKMSGRIERTDARHIDGLSGILDKPLIQSFILSNDNAVKSLEEGILAIPAAMFLT
jgi:predicted AAA+ superfamily ATPase